MYITRQSIVLHRNKKAARKAINKVAWFCVLVLLGVCAVSATIAINDPYTGDNLKGMIGLGAEVTNVMVYGLIIVGGLFLLVFQYFIVYITGNKILNYFLKKEMIPVK